MPNVSKAGATQVDDFGLGDDHRDVVDGYSISFTTLRADMDLAPLLRGLPDDMCQCLHWGYVIKGRIVWQYGDHTEVSEAGDAFYAPPGHAPRAEAGSEFLQFSPAEALKLTEAAIAANVQAMRAG